MEKTIRLCPFTEESFETHTTEHYFSSREALENSIKAADPLESFVPEKREINWSPQQRQDPQTGEWFLAAHPAQKFATKETLIAAKN